MLSRQNCIVNQDKQVHFPMAWLISLDSRLFFSDFVAVIKRNQAL